MIKSEKTIERLVWIQSPMTAHERRVITGMLNDVGDLAFRFDEPHAETLVDVLREGLAAVAGKLKAGKEFRIRTSIVRRDRRAA